MLCYVYVILYFIIFIGCKNARASKTWHWCTPQRHITDTERGSSNKQLLDEVEQNIVICQLRAVSYLPMPSYHS
jgi:hypothetical protein